VARHHIGQQFFQGFLIAASSEELKRSYSDMAGCHTRQHRAGQYVLAHDLLSGCHNG
jgi:hypothetical protein